MKKLFLIFCIVIMMLLAFPVFAYEPTKEQKQAIFMMNYAQYVTYKLKTYNNILALEEEYKNLKDNMNFQTIQDYDSVETINKLMDAIYAERQNHKNRERLKISVEKRMNKALYNSIPQITTVVTGSLNPLSLAINAMRSAGGIFISYQQYKDQLSQEFDEKMFEFQKLTEANLNTFYKDLNEYSFNLMKKYNISDEWRVNETELQQIFKFLKDSNSKRTYTNLKNMAAGRYVQHFPMFWYHLAKAAYDAGHEYEATKYYTRFERENIEIFRYDITAVDAYKGKISILLKDSNSHKEEILTKLRFIEKNKTSWTDYYFCALVYAKFKDEVNAKRLLERNISELSTEVEEQFLRGAYLDKILNENTEEKSSGFFRNLFTKNDENDVFETVGSPEYDGLELCRTLLKELGYKKISMNSIESQYRADTQSVNEILWWFGFNTSSSIIQNSKKNIKRVLVSIIPFFLPKAYQVDVQIPLQWLLSSNSSLYAVFKSNNDDKPLLIPLKINEKESKKLKGEKTTPKDTVLYYTTGKFKLDWKTEKYTFQGIFLDHPVYPLEFKYPIDNLNEIIKEVEPNGIYFNKKQYDF